MKPNTDTKWIRFINFPILIEWNYRDFVNGFFARWTRRTHQSCGTQLLLFEQRNISVLGIFRVPFGPDDLKGCAKWCRFSVAGQRISNEKRDNQIGSELQDIVYQRKIFADYIFDLWFVILGLFKLTVNGIYNAHFTFANCCAFLFTAKLIETFLIVYRYRDDALCWTDR